MSMSLILYNVSIADNIKMDKEFLQKFAKHLKELRKQKNIKQDDFLAVDGISRSTIAMIETVKTDITLSKLKIIADVLGVNPKDLLDFEN
jgi:transcriptional regulator with XRE-family HTH domain